MLHQQIQQPEPPSKFNIFMEKFAWPTITLTVSTVLAAVIIAIWLGKIQVLDFNLLMLILGFIMAFITFFSVWYFHKTRKLLQDKYQEDITSLKNDNRAFKDEFRQYYKEELERSHQFETNFSLASDKEHRERTEELKNQCMEAISDAEHRFDVSVKNTQSIFTGSVQSLQFALDSNMQYLIKTLNRMDELEENLKKDSPSESTEQEG